MGKRILVVDDDVNIRTALKLRLEREALEVTTAADGEDGLRQALAEPPDLVILDLLLPRRDGLEVLACLKNNASTAGIPIIVLTACHRTSNDDQALLSASAEVIAKPFSPRNVAQRVRDLLDAFDSGPSR